MSCGDPHDLDCEAALARLYDYIDNCIEVPDRDRIAEHLLECRGCFDEFAAEQLVKSIVARSCCQSAPAELRMRLVTRIESMCEGASQHPALGDYISPTHVSPTQVSPAQGRPGAGFGLIDPLG